jgi:glycosyltransferase involved in cell wall biosynthesis
MSFLSIITVNLNNSKGLKKTIDSVYQQIYKNIEFIIVDGNSTDESLDVVIQFEKLQKNFQFTWIHEKDNGIYHAMNKGISISTSEYLLFLNSGDFLLDPTVLEKVFESEFDEDIIACDCLVSQNGKIIHHAKPPDQISFSAFYGRTIPHQSTFIRRDLFERLGYYNENYRIHSDYEFFVNALIFQNCSYRHLPITITDYNLEGISSSSKTKSISESENHDILMRLIPDRILSDYVKWEKEKSTMKPLFWLQRKLILYKPILIIYSIAEFFVKLRTKSSKYNFIG